LIAMKGVYPDEEIAALPPDIRVIDAPALRGPGPRCDAASDRDGAGLSTAGEAKARRARRRAMPEAADLRADALAQEAQRGRCVSTAGEA
jgi:hypothetical protein